jgi:hypothetical protein
VFTPENRLDIINGLIDSLPAAVKGAAVPKLRGLKDDASFFEELLTGVTGGEAPRKLGTFSPKETTALFAAAPAVFDRVTASTPADISDSVSTGWQGDINQILDSLRGVPHIHASNFADALGEHPNARIQVLALARGAAIPGVTTCPVLKEKLGNGNARAAILACLQRHVNAPVAEAK